MTVDPKTRGFVKSQIITIDGNKKGIKVRNPLPYNYDGLPPAGTILPGNEDGTLPHDWVVLTIDGDGNVQGRLMNRPGGYGAWQYVTVYPGMIAFDQASDQASFFFLLS